MIDFENLKEGSEIWLVYKNRPTCVVYKGFIRLSTSGGYHINAVCSFSVLGVPFETPVDYCYLTELECIEEQVNYWHDMRLNRILKDNL